MMKLLLLKHAICEVFNMTYDEIFAGHGNTRIRDNEHVFPRWLYMFIRHQAGTSYSMIAKELNMDHTSVMNGVKKMKKDCATDAGYANLVRNKIRLVNCVLSAEVVDENGQIGMVM